MVSIGELFSEIKNTLEKAEIDTFRFDAQCIMEDCFGASMPMLLIKSQELSSAEAAEKVRSMAEKRAQGYPLQYILGQWEFFGYPFKVGEGVLIPRPDTETLVEKIIDFCKDRNNTCPKIADLCSGSGCIAVTLKKELPQATVFAAELSERALPYIRENAQLNGADISVVQADVLSSDTAYSLSELDAVVSNPPYLTRQEMNELQTEVTYEPETALFGGEDGLDFYRKMIPLWKGSLKNHGIIAFEIGINQHDAVADMLASEGFANIELIKDTAGIIRVVSAEKQED